MNKSAIQASIIIPTYKRPVLLAKCLNALGKSTYPRAEFEIIVVEDERHETVKAVIEKFRDLTELPELIYMQQDHNGPAAARNNGISVARGKYLLFTDDDCQPDPEWVMVLCNHLEKSHEYAGIGGLVQPLNTSTVMGQFFEFQSFLRKPPTIRGEIEYLITANAAFKKSALGSVSGFDETFRWPGGEDPDLGMRLRRRGLKLGFTEQAIVYHDYTSNPAKYLATMFNYGRGKYHVCKRHYPDTLWKRDPTPGSPFRILEQAKILKAYLHAELKPANAFFFWGLNYLTMVVELIGKSFEYCRDRRT